MHCMAVTSALPVTESDTTPSGGVAMHLDRQSDDLIGQRLRQKHTALAVIPVVLRAFSVRNKNKSLAHGPCEARTKSQPQCKPMLCGQMLDL
jgi:hypothetical protein